MDKYNIDIATKITQVEINNKLATETFTKSSNKGNAPSPSDIRDQLNKLTKKGSD